MEKLYAVSCQYMVWEQKCVLVKASNQDEAAEKAQDILKADVGAENIIIGEIK